MARGKLCIVKHDCQWITAVAVPNKVIRLWQGRITITELNSNISSNTNRKQKAKPSLLYKHAVKQGSASSAGVFLVWESPVPATNSAEVRTVQQRQRLSDFESQGRIKFKICCCSPNIALLLDPLCPGNAHILQSQDPSIAMEVVIFYVFQSYTQLYTSVS